jgi:hypothetical protein
VTRTANKTTTEITSYSSEYLSDRRTRAVLADSVSAEQIGLNLDHSVGVLNEIVSL